MVRRKSEYDNGMIEILNLQNDIVEITVNEEGCVFLIDELQELLKNPKFVTEYPQYMGNDVGVLTKQSLGLFIARKDCNKTLIENESEQNLEVYLLYDGSIQIAIDEVGCKFLIAELKKLLKEEFYVINSSSQFKRSTCTKNASSLMIVRKKLR